MQQIKKVLLLTLLSLSSTLLLAVSSDTTKIPEDTTRLYSLPIWKVWRLVKVAQIAATCDSLVKYQEVAIDKAARLQTASDSSLVSKSATLKFVEASRDEWKQRFENQTELTDLEIKGKWKWFWISLGVTLAWIGRELAF